MLYWHLYNYRLFQSIVGASDDAASVLETVRERFVEVDHDRSGFVTMGQFRHVMNSLPGTQDLTVSTCISLDGCGANHNVDVELWK